MPTDAPLLADSSRCPSCRTALPPGGEPVCSQCHLDLRGAPGVELFAVLERADALIAQMRAPAEEVLPPAVHGPPPTPTTSMPHGSRRLGVGTVPGLLLGLGALCVLVAGSLFLPFAWELLGVVGRTVVLLALTALAAFGTARAGARGLRATSEALAAVALGLLALDVLGADASGWLGDLSGSGRSVVLGAVLMVAGTSGAWAMGRVRPGGLVTAQLGAVLGTLLTVGGLATATWGTVGQRLALAVAVSLAAAAATAELRRSLAASAYRWALGGHLIVAALTWVALLLAGLVRLEEGLKLAVLWPAGAGLELVIAGVLAALPTLHPATTGRDRATLLSVALLPALVALTAPAYDEGPSVRLGLALGVAAVAALARFAATPWQRIVAPVGAGAWLVGLVLVTPLALVAEEAASGAALKLWAGRAGGSVSATWDTGTWGDAWLLPTGVTALAGAAALVTTRWTRRATAVAGAAAALVALAGALLMSAVPVWVAVAVLLGGALAAAGLGRRMTGLAGDGAAAALAGAALYVATYDDLLSLACSAGLLPVALAAHLGRRPYRRVAGGVLVLPLLAAAVWAGGSVAGGPEPWSGLGVLLTAGVVVLARWAWGARTGIVGLELGAVLAGSVSVLVGVAGAPTAEQATWLALYLTVLGVATTALALLHLERQRLIWAGGLLLAAASWVRLADLGVETVEAYTLPSALVLLAAGLWHTARHPGRGTLSAWSPGLGLALVPSLLWSLADPLSWRALVLAVACLVLTVVGAQARLAAPLAWGAAVGGLLALWETLPPAVEASAWLVSGVAGAVLLGLGASWDRRVGDARRAAAYVRGLR